LLKIDLEIFRDLCVLIVPLYHVRALNELEEFLVLIVLPASLLALLVLYHVHEVAHVLTLPHRCDYIIVEIALDGLLVLAIRPASWRILD
jgi:hypothetical protein